MNKPKLLLAVGRTAFRQPGHFAHLLMRKARFFKRYYWVRSTRGAVANVPQPLVLKFLLTYRCNLRCKKCMLWGNTGWCRDTEKSETQQDIDYALLKRTLQGAARLRPSLIFSGGEPLIYSQIDQLLSLLSTLKLPTTFCTNGTRLEALHDHLTNRPWLSLLVSLDGPEAINDTLRGTSVYRSVTESIRRLKRGPNPPHLGVQFTVREENMSSMEHFCELMAELGVDWLLFNPPWYVTPTEAQQYSQLLSAQFAVSPRTQRGYDVPFELDPKQYDENLRRIHARTWPMQISSYFRNTVEINQYAAQETSLERQRFCYKQWLRMDVLPTGAVTPCAQFPDLVLGNLHRSSLNEIWNGPEYARFRDSIKKQLLPICKKCNALYLYDAQRAVL